MRGRERGRAIRALLVVCAAAAALGAAPAHAGRGLFVGVDDDSLKWEADSPSLVALYRDLGLDAVRVTFGWRPGQRALSAVDAAGLERVVTGAVGIRVVVEIGGGPGSSPPLTAPARNQYCGLLARLVRAYPTIRDVVVWTEPNQPLFWRPPDATAYEALLARCWDVLHAAAPGVNVVASTGPHARVKGAIAPATWYAQVGAALRASRRTRPLFDTLGHNAYPDSPFEPPTTVHEGGPSIDQGDYDTLVSVLASAFAGTRQRLVPIWYLEDGYQTTVSPRAGAYRGAENVRDLLTPSEQAAQLGDAIRLAYCQPLVGAFFNFQLVDDANLAGWQSGVLYADWTPKPSYEPFRRAVEAVGSGHLTCGPDDPWQRAVVSAPAEPVHGDPRRPGVDGGLDRPAPPGLR